MTTEPIPTPAVLCPIASIPAPPLRSGAMASYAAFHAPEGRHVAVLAKCRAAEGSVHSYALSSRYEQRMRDAVANELAGQRAALAAGASMAPLGEPGALRGIAF